MTFLSLLIGKIIMKLLRLTGRTGSALPGLVVERLNPNIIGKTLGKLPGGVIIISGTNGKTTTTKIVTSLLESQGQRVLTNKTGSNFVRGIVSVIIQHASLSGKLDYDIAVFEQDEAYAVHLSRLIRPRGVVALNVMRDQMDRFGEIDTTAKLLQTLVASATDWAVLNTNDERVSALTAAKGAKTYWFGHAKGLQTSFPTDDQLYDGDAAVYHVARKPYAELQAYGDGSVTLKFGGKTEQYDYLLGGSHNAINLAAALTAVHAALPTLDMAALALAVARLEPAFGRGETFTTMDGAQVTLQLVKNPTGFMHALRMLTAKTYDVVGIAINDEYADGRDVSWLWDVDFSLLHQQNQVTVCGGTRAADMAVRLKYDEVNVAAVEPDLAAFIAAAAKRARWAKPTIIIFCTYTAMLALRAQYQEQSTEVKKVEV